MPKHRRTASTRPDKRVTAKKERQTIPTYVAGPPDPTPPVARTWGYWRIYPYGMIDDLTDRREDVEYEVITLENRYLRLSILPDLGGHLYAYDKVAGRDIFYRPGVIKPALIAMRGAWIAGGIEFNFPVSHNPLTFAPVDRHVEHNPDGSVTAYIGAYEQLSRMRWTVGITLEPDTARIDTSIRLENRTPVPHRFYFWSNSAERVSEGTRFISPVKSVHGWQGTMRYPEHDGVDVPAYRNHHVACDLFSRDIQADFFGCYDDDEDAGVINVASRHEVNGRKYFTWGNSDDGLIWENILSDGDGPYIEIQSGPFETQSIFKMMEPHHFMQWGESWYGVRGTGGFEYANKLVALNLTSGENGTVLRLFATEPIADATVTVSDDERSFGSWDADLDPAKPAAMQLDSAIDGGEVRVVISSRSHGVIAEAMLPWPGSEDDLDDRTHLDNSERETVAGLCASGLEAEQQNSVPEARNCYERALVMDPLAATALTRLGILDIKAGLFESAIHRLEQAARVLPDSGEVNYYLGLAYRRTGRVDEAVAAFWRARLDPHFGIVGRYQLGEIAAQADNHSDALIHFIDVAAHSAGGTRAWTALAILQRVMGRTNDAETILDRIEQDDPLNLTLAVERAWAMEPTGDIADPVWDHVRDRVRDDPQVWIELATEYAALGLRQSAIGLLDLCLSYGSRALVHYHRAYYLEQAGDSRKAAEERTRAAQAPVDGVYAHRTEEEPMLRAAIEVNPDDAVAPYLLGTMLFMLGRTAEGREHWNTAAERGSHDASLFAVMGWAAAKLDGNHGEAIRLYERAVELRPADHRLHGALDGIREEAQWMPEDRLVALSGLPEAVLAAGRLPQRLVQLHTQLGNWEEGEALLTSRRFNPWEGERAMRSVYTDFHTAHGEKFMDDGRYSEALTAFRHVLEYPRNVGVGKPYRPADAPFYYRAGNAAEAAGDAAAAAGYWNDGAKEKHHAIGTAGGVYRDLCRLKLDDDAARESLVNHRDTLAAKEKPAADDYAIRGVVEMALGNAAAAREAFEAALGTAPYHLLARRELARLG